MFGNGMRRDLVKKARDRKKDAVRQAELKTELNIREEENTRVIERTNWGDTIRKLILDLALLALSALALVGLVALVYPAPRAELYKILMDTIEQFRGLVG